MQLSVWRRTPGGALLLVGELRVAQPDQAAGGRQQGEFRYAPEYLNHAEALALDPIHLPLRSGIFPASAPESGLHGVFEDSLPDAWGRALLIRQHRLARADQTPVRLLACLGARGLGALSYATGDAPPAPESRPVLNVETLVDAAVRYDADPATVNERDLDTLFRAASSPGGARPKILLHDGGRACIAKLGSTRDRADMVRVEAVCLALAREAGLSVPSFRVQDFGRHAALLVERFDCTAQGRRHMLSAQTLLGATGWYQLGYSDLADVVRTLSGKPEQDIPALYRQMVFNAMLGNTDDHLKNFSIYHTGAAWRLTPAYDLLPDEPRRGEHVLHFGAAGQRPTREALINLARTFGVPTKAATRIREEVAAALSQWPDQCEQAGVPSEDCQRLAGDVQQRLAHLSGQIR
jgi:serine/threonine-protein kinase HipA